jgi:hypothetical protein
MRGGDAFEAHHAADPSAVDRPSLCGSSPMLGEERRRGREVVDHNADVPHALDRHPLDRGRGTVRSSAARARAA